MDGGSFDLTAPRWLVVNYWAEWCGPCRHEIPELNALHSDGQEPALAVLGVNYDALQPPELGAVGQRMGIEFPVAVGDPRARWEQPLPTVLPSTFLIDPDGGYVDTLVGPQTAATIRARIAELAEPGAGAVTAGGGR